MKTQAGSMRQLTIDPALCSRCGACETVLPGLLEKSDGGRLLVSACNMAAHGAEIARAVDTCRMGALTVEEVGYGRV